MEKLEKVIKALEICATGLCTEDCPYHDVDCFETIARDALEILKAQEPVEARLHLCESCVKVYPDCDATADGIVYGCGTGNDNVIGCTEYVNRWKAQEPRVLTLEEADEADVCWLEVADLKRIPPVRVSIMKDGIVSIGRFRAASETAMANEYGTIWRCWSARPTVEQMMAVRWE